MAGPFHHRNLTAPASLERIDDFGVFRPMGSCTFQQAVQLIASAITSAREQGLDKLLLVITGLTGFNPPSLSERHEMVRGWAEAAQGRLKLAMVTPPELIDPERFGVIAAANFGLRSYVCTSESDAIAWLHEVP